MGEMVKMALIATYPQMADIFLELTKQREEIQAYSVYASFERAVEVAKEMERKGEVDVILSRGGTAAQIKNAVDVPVVFIPITPFDVIKIVHQLPPDVKEVALIHYMKNVYGIQDIAQMYGIEIHEYSFINYLDIEQAVTDAYNNGIRTIIGGEVAVRLAEGKGMTGHQLSAGKEAVDRAIEEVMGILGEKRKEHDKALQLKAAYDSLNEGIVVTDENHKVVVFNKMSERIFGRKYNAGDAAENDIMNESCLQVYQSQKEGPVYLKKNRKATYAVAHIPILKEGKFKGVVSRIEDVTRTQELEQKIRKEMHLKGFVAKYQFPDIYTADPGMKRAIQRAEVYAKTDSAVLIEGESGTGKELLAQSIHNGSKRKEGPFVAVNCAAIPENLLESELFGYEAGAFTGARKEGKMGLFELAHNGTLFLDEIGEISKNVQTRLLRVLQEKEIMRVGGNRIIPIDVRIISATNKDLKEQAKSGTFREDLYYRLNVLQIMVPPLRKRKGDVELLSRLFLQDYGADESQLETIMPILNAYTWPGNIRELQNTTERYGVLLDTGTLDTEELCEILGTTMQHKSGNRMELEIEIGGELNEIIDQVEYEIVNRYLEEFDHNQDLAAKALGIGRTTFWRKCKGKNE